MLHRIIMPDLGQTVAEGKIVRWLKRPGDAIVKGEPLLEVETDKVTMEVESYRSGYLREFLIGEGEMAAAQSPIALVTDEPGETYDSSGQQASPVPQIQTAVTPPLPDERKAGEIKVAPAARMLARDLGLDLNAISGTGPGGLITRKDVEQFSTARRDQRPIAAMASLVTRSMQTIPHFYLTADVSVAAAEQWRSQWNASHPDLHATYNHMFVRAASLSLRDVPELNTSYAEGKYEQRSAADVLLVVAVDMTLHLVPVPDPGGQSWQDYLAGTAQVLGGARAGKVAHAHVKGTPLLAVSNLGMFGVKQFAGIIPPSCTAILAIGAARDEASFAGQQLQATRVVTLTLSADHRVVDGITAARFMQRMQEHLNHL